MLNRYFIGVSFPEKMSWSYEKKIGLGSGVIGNFKGDERVAKNGKRIYPSANYGKSTEIPCRVDKTG